MSSGVKAQDRLARFLECSAELTAFTVFQLRGTGQAESYLAAVEDVVRMPMVDELLNAYAAIPPADKGDARAYAWRLGRLRQDIFAHKKLGPLARNIIKLWYIGTWFELPDAWHEEYGPLSSNVRFVVSATSYVEGLLWTAIGAHPEGAKAQGFGSWARAPDIPAF